MKLLLSTSLMTLALLVACPGQSTASNEEFLAVLDVPWKKVLIDESVPPLYPNFVAERADRDIGYVRFSAFLPPVDQRFFQALELMPDNSGLIIDLRVNHGGIIPVRKAMAEKLLTQRTLLWTYERRAGA